MYNFINLITIMAKCFFHPIIQDFISHPCCKSLLDKQWYGELSDSRNRAWQVLLALLTIFFPVMVFFKLHYRHQKGKQPAFYRKLGIFFCAPITKFWLHLVCLLFCTNTNNVLQIGFGELGFTR